MPWRHAAPFSCFSQRLFSVNYSCRLTTTHFYRFRSSWIDIDNGDASGGRVGAACAVQSGVEARGSSTATHCRSARVRPCRLRGPLAAGLPDSPSPSRGSTVGGFQEGACSGGGNLRRTRRGRVRSPREQAPGPKGCRDGRPGGVRPGSSGASRRRRRSAVAAALRRGHAARPPRRSGPPARGRCRSGWPASAAGCSCR